MAGRLQRNDPWDVFQTNFVILWFLKNEEAFIAPWSIISWNVFHTAWQTHKKIWCLYTQIITFWTTCVFKLHLYLQLFQMLQYFVYIGTVWAFHSNSKVLMNCFGYNSLILPLLTLSSFVSVLLFPHFLLSLEGTAAFRPICCFLIN